MREMLFRGLDVNYNVWKFGSLIEYSNGQSAIITTADKYGGKVFTNEVIPETVGQYTGLKDRNDVEIYEGDIITTDLERPYLIVEYRNGAFMLNCNDGLDDYYDIFFGTSEEPEEFYKYGEVIGNTHDNPELMGEKK